jgi:two-component system sensor histidine kinase BaeS
MRTLRSRLILSHILPLLLIVPLICIALIYLLETQVLLANLSDELMRQGTLTAAMARDQPAIWSDATVAQRFVTRFSVRSQSHVMLLDPNGNLLASSAPEDSGQLGQPLDLLDLPGALAGEEQVQINYTRNLQAEIVQVLVPVVGPNQEIIGVVHLAQQLSGVHRRFAHLRYLIVGVLGVGLLLGVIVGLVLALNLGRPLRQVTEAIGGVASGREWKTLPEQGPEEIRLLLRAFNTLTERLRMLEESRRHLLANLVHELGRPLGALQSALQALLSGAGQEPALRHELLDGMDAQVKRLRPLLDSLADLHGQVLGTLELNRRPTALSDWLPRTVTPWRQAAHDKSLHWRTAIPDSLPVIEIDPDRLAQVLGNLLSNAVKYTTEGTVSVEAYVRDDGVAIVVSDTGIGIAPHEQARVFEPFYRSQRDKRFPQGMGLGLSIARDLVVAHGGRLEVESTPGVGSHFTLWLPFPSHER